MKLDSDDLNHLEPQLNIPTDNIWSDQKDMNAGVFDHKRYVHSLRGAGSIFFCKKKNYFFKILLL